MGENYNCLPYSYPKELEISRKAADFIECAQQPDYTIDQAREDAFVFLNMRNAIDAGFIGPLIHKGPGGRIEFDMHPDTESNS